MAVKLLPASEKGRGNIGAPQRIALVQERMQFPTGEGEMYSGQSQDQEIG